MTRPLAIGLDVGSTTVKAVVVDAETREILWRDYQRHETRQPEKAMEFMVRIGEAFPDATDIQVTSPAPAPGRWPSRWGRGSSRK